MKSNKNIGKKEEEYLFLYIKTIEISRFNPPFGEDRETSIERQTDRQIDRRKGQNTYKSHGGSSAAQSKKKKKMKK